MTVARFAIPDGWTVQAFCFALDPSPAQAACLRRQFGGRRYARNWAVRTSKKTWTGTRRPGSRPRRHVTLPRIGTVRVHENTRKLQRLLAKGRARILAVTISRKG